MISFDADLFIRIKINRSLSRKKFPVLMETPEKMFQRMSERYEQRMFTCIDIEVALPSTWNSR